MKLLLLTAAFFGVAFSNPTGPAMVGEESPIAPASDDVTQTRTVSNSIAVNGNLNQDIEQRNGVSNYPTSFVFRDVTQTSTLSNSGAVYGNLIQYIVHINGLTDNSRSFNVVEKMVVNGNAPISLTGPASVGQDSSSVCDNASISDDPMTRRNVFRDVTQTSTLSNSGAVSGQLTQYIIHVNGMTRNRRNLADSVAIDDDHEDAAEAGSKSAIAKELIKKIVETMSANGIEGLKNP